MREFRSVSWLLFEYLLCQLHHFRRNRMRARVGEAKSRGSFLGGNFRWSFNRGAKWITQLAGVFSVSVVNAPKLVAGLQSRARSHGCSSPQAEFAKMYQLHKMRGQSV